MVRDTPWILGARDSHRRVDVADGVMKKTIVIIIGIALLAGCEWFFGPTAPTFERTVMAADNEWNGSWYVISMIDSRLDGDQYLYFIELQPAGYTFWVDLDTYIVPSGDPIFYVGVNIQMFMCFAGIDLIGDTLRFTPIPRDIAAQ